MLREAAVPLLQVRYESLVASPESELERIFSFLGLEHQPDAVNYKKRFEAKEGMGDPIGVKKHDRPTTESVEKWVPELLADPAKLTLAREIIARLSDEDLETWGYPRATLFAPLEASAAAAKPLPRPPVFNKYVLQRRVIRSSHLYRQTMTPGNYVRHDRSIDERVGYQTRSMITAPMISPEGRVLAVIQLINAKLGAAPLHIQPASTCPDATT